MITTPKLVIWGAGGHAKVVADIIRLRAEFLIAGFVDDVAFRPALSSFLDAPLYYGLEALDRLQTDGVRFLIMGFGDCRARLERSKVAQMRGWLLATAVHPHAVIAASAKIGGGTVVAAGAVVNPEAQLGDNVIINTLASVDHECVVGDGAHISPGARLAGRVTVGQGALIGIGATVLPGVRIGAASEIGAGSLVRQDVPDGMIAYGVPARVVRLRTGGAPSSR